MIFMFLGVAASVKLVCTALDLLHKAAHGEELAEVQKAIPERVLAVRPPVRLYTSREEGMAGEGEGEFTEAERCLARHTAEQRFGEIANKWPHCKRCHEPITNPQMIGAAT